MEWPERPDNGAEATQTSDTLRSWLARGTHRLGVDPRRGKGRNQRARQLLASETGWLPGDHSGWRGLVTALQRHSVLNALAQLHRSDRQLLTMAYLQGHTNIEIGRMLHVSARTVSRRLSAALARLEEHAQNVGIWIASLVLVGLAALTRTQERVWNSVRSIQWQQAAAVATAGTAVVALGLAGETAIPPPTQQSVFSPSGRSIAVAPPVYEPSELVAPGPTAVLETAAPRSVNPVLKNHVSPHQNVVIALHGNGCGPKPTNAPPPVPVGPRTSHPAGPPVTRPGPRARGCKA
jgi:sigma-70-like protein